MFYYLHDAQNALGNQANMQKFSNIFDKAAFPQINVEKISTYDKNDQPKDMNDQPGLLSMANIADMEKEIQESRIKIEQDTATIKARNEEIVGHIATIATRDGTIKDRDTEIVGHKGTIADRDTEIVGHKGTIATRDGTINERDTEIVGHKTTIATRERTI